MDQTIKNFPRTVFILLMLTILVRFSFCAVEIVFYRLGTSQSFTTMILEGRGFDAPYFILADSFADSLKSGLAQRSISGVLLTDPKVQEWPEIFKGYLFNNPYLSETLSIYHTPPLANVQLMGVAFLIVLFSPTVALFIQIAVFFLGCYIVSWFWNGDGLRNDFNFSPWILAILLMCYPALFMISRGNFHSGFTSLSVCLYLLSLSTGNSRLLGLLAMAVAINYRPNVAIISIVEILVATNFRSGITNILKLAVISIVGAGLGLAVSNRIDSAYDLPHFVRGLHLYCDLTVFGDAGLGWNTSFYGLLRNILKSSGLQVAPLVDPSTVFILLTITSSVGAVLLVAVLMMLFRRKLTLTEATFIAASWNALFTPVYAEYHVLAMAAPLLILIRRHRMSAIGVRSLGIWGPFIAVSAASQIFWAWPGWASLTLLLLISAGIPVMASLPASRQPELTRTESMILVVCILCLSPLGGTVSNGVAISMLLLVGCGVVTVLGLNRSGSDIVKAGAILPH